MGTPTWAQDRSLLSSNPSLFIHDFMDHCDLPLHTPACLLLRFASLSRDNTTCQSCAFERLSIGQFTSTERLLCAGPAGSLSLFSAQMYLGGSQRVGFASSPLSSDPYFKFIHSPYPDTLSFINSLQQVTPLTCRPHQSPAWCNSGYSFRLQIGSSSGQGWCDPV